MKIVIISSFILILVGFGCQSAEVVTNIGSDESVDTSVDGDQLATTAAGSDDALFVAEDYVPTAAQEVEVTDLDLDGDGESEKLLTYQLEDVQLLETSDARDTVYYLRVYRLQNDRWQTIKEDQKTQNFYGQAGNFCILDVVRFANTERDYLLVSKCHAFGPNEGYYLFGQLGQSEIFGDLQISKAYLHQSDYLLESGDQFLGLENVTATSDGLIEYYGVACEAKPDTYSHFGGDNTGYCRQLEVFQQFDGEGFSSEPVLTIKK